MKSSNQVRQLAYDLAVHYCHFDRDHYTLNINDISEFDLDELSALIMSQDSAMATEATGPDNASYENKMLPALIKYLSNSSDKDEEIEFNSIWKKGIVSYFYPAMEQLLAHAMDEYNQNEGFTNKEEVFSSRKITQGSVTWA